MKRWRMVSIQNGHESVSSVVVSADEAREHIEFEALMHERCGWTVTRGDGVAVARQAGIERIITAREFDAMDDFL